MGKRMKLADEESDYNKKLAQAEAEQKLSIVSDAFGSIAQLAGEQSALGKSSAIAQATINTFQGATKAIAELPPPFNFIAAASTVAAGLAQVKKIVAVKAPNEKPTSVQVPSASVPVPSFRQQNINGGVVGPQAGPRVETQPVRAYVIATEVTSAQEANKKISDRAKL